MAFPPQGYQSPHSPRQLDDFLRPHYRHKTWDHKSNLVLFSKPKPHVKKRSTIKLIPRFKGISHYEDPIGADKLTALPCPGELLVEEHHRNYGEPSVGEHDVFEFLASSVHLSHDACVLEIECGTLRVGLHFICST